MTARNFDARDFAAREASDRMISFAKSYIITGREQRMWNVVRKSARDRLPIRRHPFRRHRHRRKKGRKRPYERSLLSRIREKKKKRKRRWPRDDEFSIEDDEKRSGRTSSLVRLHFFIPGGTLSLIIFKCFLSSCLSTRMFSFLFVFFINKVNRHFLLFTSG